MTRRCEYTNKQFLQHSALEIVSKWPTGEWSWLMHDKREFWFFFLHIFKWTYGNASAGPSAQLPRPAFLLPREQVQNSSFRELPRSRFFRIFLEVLPRSHGELPRKLYLGVVWKCVICILGWVNMGEPFFMILSSIQMDSGSFSASAWKVCFRKASAKLPQRIWTLLPKDRCQLVFTTAHVKQLHRIKHNICLYTISLYVVHKKCKRHNNKFLQNALPRSFHVKKCEYCFRELPRLQYGESFWLICPNPA